jgi:hypothetical protein
MKPPEPYTWMGVDLAADQASLDDKSSPRSDA